MSLQSCNCCSLGLTDTLALFANEARLFSDLGCSYEHVLSKTKVKALANEDTLWWTHCCRHKCFPVCPRGQHLRTQMLCPGHKKCFWFCSETFCVRSKCFPVCAAQETSWATMCPQQCVLVNGHKMFLNKIRNTFCVPDTKFVSATNVARAGKRGNICVGNNVSATMCPRLPGP